jgi:rSAM-associated Gly-rich repeat protein
VGVSLALGAAAPAAASNQPTSADNEKVSERLAAVRAAVSLTASKGAEVNQAEPRVAWWFRNGGYWGFPNFRNWGNGWGNGGWGNWFHNW